MSCLCNSANITVSGPIKGTGAYELNWNIVPPTLSSTQSFDLPWPTTTTWNENCEVKYYLTYISPTIDWNGFGSFVSPGATVTPNTAYTGAWPDPLFDSFTSTYYSFDFDESTSTPGTTPKTFTLDFASSLT